MRFETYDKFESLLEYENICCSFLLVGDGLMSKIVDKLLLLIATILLMQFDCIIKLI